MHPNDQHEPSHLARDPLLRIVRELRQSYRSPLSFVQAEPPADVAFPEDQENIPSILDALVAQATSYRWREVAARKVLYPKDPAWDTIVSRIEINDVPRIHAATAYVRKLRDQAPALRVEAPPIKGDPRARLFTERVSLQSTSSLVEHLVQLLGVDQWLVFTIEWTRSGQRVLHFDRVNPH